MGNYTRETRLSRVEETISTELDQEKVLMNIEAGVYYGLAGTARSIWDALESPHTFGELIDSLVAQYEVDLEVCQAYTIKFLDKLKQEGLLRVE